MKPGVRVIKDRRAKCLGWYLVRVLAAKMEFRMTLMGVC